MSVQGLKMIRKREGRSVVDAALARLIEVYEQGHRLVVSFSAGKDSGATLEMCIEAATLTGRLPVEVVMRDEEIMFPGTYEYALRTAERPEVKMTWLVARQPIVNCYNRARPYFWVFDDQLEPEQWVRQPPDWTTWIEELNIEMMTIPKRFPPEPGKQLMAVLGLRTAESRNRLYGLMSSGSYLTKPNRFGVVNCRPLYDWQDADVWKAHHEFKWDYNHAYDVMHKMGLPKSRLRIAPPTLSPIGAVSLQIAAKAWPKWFDRVCERLPGVRAAALFGLRAVTPTRKENETWQECFERTCIKDAPPWISERAQHVQRRIVGTHSRHSARVPIPEYEPCATCQGNAGSWRNMVKFIYNGDPFAMKFDFLGYVEPEFFRKGAGTWGGIPSW